MVSRNGSRRRERAATPLGRAVRRALLLLGLGAILCGAVWSAVSITSPAPEPLSAADAFLSGAGLEMPCLSVRARQEMESESCFHTVQRELVEGRLDLDEAIARLEACGSDVPEMRGALERHAELRREARRARIAFGLPVARVVGDSRGSDASGGSRLEDPAPSRAAVDRLASAGITPAGFAGRDGRLALARLRALPQLRRDFREVFGPRTAGDLERLISPDGSGPLRAVVIGGSVILPDAPVRTSSATTGGKPAPFVLPLYDYAERVRDELFLLDEARLRYLDAAARSHRWQGSIGRFVAGLVEGEVPDARSRSSAAQAEIHRTVLLARLRALEPRLGLDPALVALAREGVATTLRLSEACEAAASRRGRWVSTGAGVVTGLTGAAAVVVATGVAGTIGGGVTIAAALEAAGTAYLTYRSEQATLRTDFPDSPPPYEPPPLPEPEPFRQPDRGGSLARGEEGRGRGEMQDPREGGEWEEWDEEGEGEGAEIDEGEEATEPEPRRNTVPAELPPPPEAVLELPPMLDAGTLADLERVTLAEAQERLDEFLSLASAVSEAPEPRPEALRSLATSELIEEARDALRLWVDERELSAGFGWFFLRAEMEELPAGRRPDVLARASNRYERDRAVYEEATTVEELRRRVAERLVVHCRAGAARGDLMLEACSDPTALTLVLVAALRDAGLAAPQGTVLGVQAQGADFHAVLFDAGSREVLSLITGDRTNGVIAPIYHPASFYYGFLAENGVPPEIDPDEHLLIAPADPGHAAPAAACEEPRRNLIGRVVDWIRRVVGVGVPSRPGAACGGIAGGVPARTGEADDDDGGRRGGFTVTVSRPSIGVPMGGGGQPGASQGSGGGGGAGDGASSGGRGGSGGNGDGEESSGGRTGGRASGEGGSGGASASESAGKGGGRNGAEGGTGTGGSGSSGGAAGGGAGAGAAATAASTDGGEGGDAGRPAAAGASGPGEALDLAEVARETSELARAARDDRALRLRPWRLRADHSFIPSPGRVLYADNEHALSRFGPDERFVTMSPSATEEQRRMFEADSFPVFPAGTGCDVPELPPRRVFRRSTGAGDGFRYVYCDHDESIVAFRSRDDAASYAALGAPDRPLLLTRLASERIAHFQRSPEVARIHEFLRDPDVLRELSVTELDSLVSTAGQLLWLQERLEAALFQTMGELEGSGLRGYYYELHRQVAQSPVLIELVGAVYRFNRRLASDPLRTLAWAEALPPEHRERFFQLYFALGGTMYWPLRWEALHLRYAEGLPPAPIPGWSREGPSLDFLQVMSDPTRVQVDWPDERPPSRPSIRDRRVQAGVGRTEEERVVPTGVEERDRQDVTERRRGGTRGLGRTGEGDGLGPERGRRPLQMIRIRMKPETGDPDRPRFPEDNATRPGGTEGTRKVQELSASRQEPALWVSPETFVDAILSGWDPPRDPPARADRVAPALRFSPRLRELFLQEMNEGKTYEGRLIYAVSILTSGGWLRYEAMREAMGGAWTGVRAHDTGRYTVEYSMAAAIVDQDQVRGPDFFTRTSVDLPADLVAPVRKIFTRDGFGSFDLQVLEPREPVRLPPPEPGSEEAAAARERLLRALRLIEEQARP